jgi:regulator of replication initiation timing
VLPLKQIICDLSEQNRTLRIQNQNLNSKLKQVSDERDLLIDQFE